MKKRRKFVTALVLLVVCAVIYCSPAAWAYSMVSVDPPCEYWKGTFHGIWIGASKNLEDAKREAEQASDKLGVVQIFLTTDWSNLNTEPWYVLTAGMYASRPEAEDVLPSVQAYYPDAYIKFSGTRTGSFTGNAYNTSSETSATLQPFYGIWCQGTKSSSEAEKYARQLRNNGFSGASVFMTTDWSNLNREQWYVVTAGVYRTEAEAKSSLSRVRAYYSDAYVKYSGHYQGGAAGSTSKASSAKSSSTQPSSAQASGQPFYGIWCQGTKSSSEAERYARQLRNNGFSGASVFMTTDWSNLNREPWYVVTAGVYRTEAEAKSSLSRVRAYYSDAYVKYSGAYVGN